MIYGVFLLIAIELWTGIFWRNVVLVLAGIASVVTSIGIINSKVIAPLIAKPLANALKKELGELIEATILSDPLMAQFGEHIEEVVARESGLIVHEVALVKADIRALKVRLGQLEDLQIRFHEENQRRKSGNN